MTTDNDADADWRDSLSSIGPGNWLLSIFQDSNQRIGFRAWSVNQNQYPSINRLLHDLNNYADKLRIDTPSTPPLP